MNADKTQLVWLGTRQQLAKLTTTELPAAFCPCQAFVRSDRTWRQRRRSAGRAYFNYASYTDGQIFTDFGGREDAGTRVRQQPS